MKKIVAILSLFCLANLVAQEIDSTKIKEIEMLEKMMYGINSEIFKKQDYYSKLDKEFKFPWKDKRYSPEQLNNALDSIAENSKIQVNEGGFSSLVLEFDSYFPTYIKKVSDIFNLTIKSNKINNLKGKVAEIDKDGSVGFGSKFSSGYEDGKSFSFNWKTITKTFNIRSSENKKELKGDVIFSASFILDYDFVKINKSNIGQSFMIGLFEFEVIDFFDNKVILHFKNDIGELRFSFFNVDNKGNKISQIPLFNFEELKERNNKIPSDAYSLPEGSQTISKTNYDLFKSNPKLSFDDYKKIVHNKFVEIINSENQKEMVEKVLGTKYVIFSATDKMQNFFLYLPGEYIEKEFKLTLD